MSSRLAKVPNRSVGQGPTSAGSTLRRRQDAVEIKHVRRVVGVLDDEQGECKNLKAIEQNQPR